MTVYPFIRQFTFLFTRQLTFVRPGVQAHHQLVQTAVDGGMNTLRVWGGGMFLPDAWYDAGILTQDSGGPGHPAPLA